MLTEDGRAATELTATTGAPPAVETTETPLQFKTVVAVAAGVSHSLALCSDGTLAAWGDNSYGELGLGSTSTTPNPVPQKGKVKCN